MFFFHKLTIATLLFWSHSCISHIHNKLVAYLLHDLINGISYHKFIVISIILIELLINGIKYSSQIINNLFVTIIYDY